MSFIAGFEKTAGPIGRGTSARMADAPDTHVRAERHYAASRLNSTRAVNKPKLKLVSSQKFVHPSFLPRLLSKAAAFDHNNQGLEFKMSDMGNPAVGPGGMGPSGDETYQPAEPTAKGKTKADKQEMARRIIGKLYKMSSGENAALSDSGGSDIASTTVDQLKYTFQNGPTLEQEAADNKEQKNRRKAYLRARSK